MTNPLDSALSTARLLGTITDYVPLHVLEAAADALIRSAEWTLSDVRSQPGRRGNPRRRHEAWDDHAAASELSSAARERRRVLATNPHHRHRSSADRTWQPHEDSRRLMFSIALQVEEAPDLGPEQWAVVAANAPTWKGSPIDLFMVARATVPDDTPLDWRRWQAGRRRQRCLDRRREAEVRLSFRLDHLRAEMDAASRAATRAQESRDQAERWSQELSAHTQAIDLDDVALAAYEAAIDAGVTAKRALAIATRPPSSHPPVDLVGDGD
jgi:hypothetical protein